MMEASSWSTRSIGDLITATGVGVGVIKRPHFWVEQREEKRPGMEGELLKLKCKYLIVSLADWFRCDQQCDQIWQFSKVLGYKFSGKSSKPKYLLSFWNILINKNCFGYF